LPFLLFALTILLLTTFPISVEATCPRFDSVEYEGKSLTIYQNTEVPKTSEYLKWKQSLRCSSRLHPGRARYKIVDKSIYLVEFSGCSENLKPSVIYPLKGDNIAADWLPSEFDAYGGKYICKRRNSFCMIYDTKYHIKTKNGVVLSVTSEPNPDLEQCTSREGNIENE